MREGLQVPEGPSPLLSVTHVALLGCATRTAANQWRTAARSLRRKRSRRLASCLGSSRGCPDLQLPIIRTDQAASAAQALLHPACRVPGYWLDIDRRFNGL